MRVSDDRVTPRARPAGFRLLVLCLLARCFSAAAAQPLTLEEAWRQAEVANPGLLQAQAIRTGAEAEAAQAHEPLFNNPQLSTELERLEFSPINGAAQQSGTQWNVGLSQTLELPIKQRARRLATDQSLSATERSIEATRQQIRAEVEQRFIRVLALQQRDRLEAQTLDVVEDAARATQKLVDSGEVPILQGNIAEVEAERERNQIAALREQLLQARAELAVLLQLPADQLPEVSGELAPRPLPYTLDDLLAAAAHRPSRQAALEREHAARSRLDFERASAYPDITIGINAGRVPELDSRDRVAGVTVSVPLPLFNRNQAEIGKALATWRQAQVEQEVDTRNARTEVMALWQRLQLLSERVDRLNRSVMPRLEQNSKLARLSYAAGQMDLLQFLLVNRQVTDAQRDALDAITDLMQTRASLEAAAGWVTR